MTHNAVDAGARALGAYDKFLGLLDQDAFRKKLESLRRDDAADSPEFKQMQLLGDELEDGLLALLFETESLPELVREYAIF